jgi:ribonuclease Z
MHGRDIRPTLSEAGKTQWLDLFQDEHVVVHAAPIRHSVACVGYVVCEKPIPGKIDLSLYAPHLERNRAALAALGVRQPNMKLRELQKGNDVHLPDGTVLRPPIPRPGFKMAILGDTCDSSGIADLAQSCDLLIHEATNAHLPGVDPETKEEDTEQTVEARTRSHGHSTPQMAGMFASTVQAKRLILNHFSARYAGDDDTNEESAKIMNGIADLARRHYNGEVTCARDFMTVEVQRPKAG